MSVRAVGMRLFKHGRSLVQHICKRDLNTTISDKINAVAHATVAPSSSPSQIIPRNFALRNVGAQLGLQARRILIDNVLNRVTNSLSSDLRKKATRRILFGDSAPFFALVGVSLAAGSGILTKEEELEGICWEIREAISKIDWHYHDVNETRFETAPVSLDNLTLGKPIAKGSNGVVYSAQIKDSSELSKLPFALKMMFNYDIQSNSMEILKAMYRETVPARLYNNSLSDANNLWEVELAKRRRHLPPHPNIIAIFSVFTDYIQEFQQSKELYPAALPRRVHPEGEGRNMSLFLLMKNYDCSLQSYLQNEISTRTSILLFAQLLEGIAHLTAHAIAHRDLKSDNLLLDTNEPDSPILVISDFGCCLADKNNGLSLPYTSHEIDKGGNVALMAPEIYSQEPGTFSMLNYTKSDLWAAGTIAYEIFGCANPFYSKSSSGLRNFSYKEKDLPQLPKQVPVIIRHLIGNLLQRNPNKRLNAEVAANVCQLFLWAPSSWLKQGIKVPTSADILQWLLSLTTKVLCEGRVNDKNFAGSETKNFGRRTYPEYLLISSFLCRAKLANIRSALFWIQDNLNLEVNY